MELSDYDSPADDNTNNNNATESAATSDDRVMGRTRFDCSQHTDYILTIFQDEHGQSVLHFACARSHGRNALVQLIEESGVSLAYRDELYRTARDVSMQATQPENTREIDKYVLSLAARGNICI